MEPQLLKRLILVWILFRAPPSSKTMILGHIRGYFSSCFYLILFPFLLVHFILRAFAKRYLLSVHFLGHSQSLFSYRLKQRRKIVQTSKWGHFSKCFLLVHNWTYEHIWTLSIHAFIHSFSKPCEHLTVRAVWCTWLKEMVMGTQNLPKQNSNCGFKQTWTLLLLAVLNVKLELGEIFMHWVKVLS